MELLKWVLVIILHSTSIGIDEIITVVPMETEILCQEAARKMRQIPFSRNTVIQASCLRTHQ